MNKTAFITAAFCLSTSFSTLAQEKCKIPDNSTVSKWSTGFENGISAVVNNETIDSEKNCDVQLAFQKWLSAAKLKETISHIAGYASFGLKLANPPPFNGYDVKPFWKLMGGNRVVVSYFHLQDTTHQFYISDTYVERMFEKAEGFYSHGFPGQAIIDFATTAGKCVELQTTWRPGNTTRQYRYFGIQLAAAPYDSYYGTHTSNLELWLKEGIDSETTQEPTVVLRITETEPARCNRDQTHVIVGSQIE